MSYNPDAFSQSGRTTRMLQAACKFDQQGRAVYVIAANDNHAEVLRDQLLNMLPDNTIKVETAASLSNFDWETMSLRRAHPNCIVLVDHWAIQQRFNAMLTELHRYDPT